MKRIVFIPGIMGSDLYEGGRLLGATRRWFNMSNNSLRRLHIDSKKSKRIYAGGPLEYGYKFVGGSYIKKNNVYGPIVKMLTSCENDKTTFHPYGYDWRLDLFDVCADLHGLLNKFDKSDDVYIVAHSMGGLLIHTYCQWALGRGIIPNVKKVITIGTPWKGSPDSLKVLLYGIKDRGFFFPDESAIIKASRTFPSTFQLMPSADYCQQFGEYFSKDGRKLRWKECMDYARKLEGCNVEDAENLNRKLHNSLKAPWPSSIEHYNMSGFDQGSLGKFKIQDNTFAHGLEPLDGDGVVPYTSAMPLQSYGAKDISYTKASHQGLVLHQPVLNWVRSIIINGSPKPNINGVFSSFVPRTDWVLAKIDCPVEVILEGEFEDANKATDDITRHTIGEATYLIYNEPKPANIFVEAYDEGVTSIETIKIVENKVEFMTKFPTIEADPAKRAVISIDFENELPNTTVYLASDEKDGEEHLIAGVNFRVPSNLKQKPPKTKLTINNIENQEDLNPHLKVQALVSVEENQNSKYLETLYKINDKNIKSAGPGKLIFDEQDGLKFGKNVIEFYSIDVLGNKEKIQKQYFRIEPNTPRISLEVSLEPERDIVITLKEYYEGISPYRFFYKVGLDGKVKDYKAPISFKSHASKELFFQAKDEKGKMSEWEKLDLKFQEISDLIWNESGFEGTFEDIISALPKPNLGKHELQFSVFVGKNEKKITDKISKTAKKIDVVNPKVQYKIEMTPKLELYLEHHSQMISRKEKIIVIKFRIYDADDRLVEELQPYVKYTLLPTKNADLDTVIPGVLNNGKGVYSFNIPVDHLSKEVKKIKIEFRESISRNRPLESRTFKLN